MSTGFARVIETHLPNLTMQRMELAGADMIMGYAQDGLATIGPIAVQQVPSTARTCCQPGEYIPKGHLALTKHRDYPQ
jgi:hypothetical protein